jgi:hypothetical protein
MAIAEHIGYDATGRDDANELPDILDAYREFKRGKRDFFGDAPLCFWVGRGDVIKRLDPAYYKPEHHTTDAILQSSQYKVAKLSDYLERVMHPPEFKREYVKHGLIYLRSQNVRPYQLDFADRVFVNPARYKSLPEAKPKPGDLLFVRSGVNVGDCAYVREELPNAVYSADILVCKLKANLSPAGMFHFSQKITLHC